jgi:hypothetical protein
MTPPGMSLRMNGSLVVVEKGDARRVWTRSYVEVVVLPYVQKGHDWSLGYKLPSLDESEVLRIMTDFARHGVTA